MDNKIYSNYDFDAANAQLKKHRIIFYCGIFAYAALAITLFVIYLGLPYKHPKITTVKLLTFFLTVIAFTLLYFFYNLKLSRLKKYNIILNHIVTGIKENNFGEFLRFSSQVEVKDGVEFKSIIFSEWSEKKQDFYERKVWLDLEKEFPPFNVGEKIHYITQGNIILEYQTAKEKN